MNVRWSAEAVAALAAIEVGLVARYSETRATEIIDELVQRIELLSENPKLGRIVPEYGHWQLRELVDKWNRVLYRLQPHAIEIVTIVGARMALVSDPEND